MMPKFTDFALNHKNFGISKIEFLKFSRVETVK